LHEVICKQSIQFIITSRVVDISVDSGAMFPLSCTRVRAHTGRKTRAHKKTWSAQKMIFQKCFCTYVYTSMCKNIFRKIIFCELHAFLFLLLMIVSITWFY